MFSFVYCMRNRPLWHQPAVPAAKGMALVEYQEDRIAGVSPGGVRDPYWVKILICYLLQKLGTPVSEERLVEILTDDQTVNYFLLMTTFAELKRLGHVEKQGNGYVLTELGQKTAGELSGELPMTLRERVLCQAGETERRRRRRDETATGIAETEDGWRVDFSFHDEELEFMKLSLYAPDREQALQLQDGLLRQYQDIYVGLLERLLRDHRDS